MNESNRNTKQKKNEITNKKNQNNTTKATSNLPSSPTSWKKMNMTLEYGVKPKSIYI